MGEGKEVARAPTGGELEAALVELAVHLSLQGHLQRERLPASHHQQVVVVLVGVVALLVRLDHPVAVEISHLESFLCDANENLFMQTVFNFLLIF